MKSVKNKISFEMFILPKKLEMNFNQPPLGVITLRCKYPDKDFISHNPTKFVPIYNFDIKYGHNNDPARSKSLIGWYYLAPDWFNLEHPSWSILSKDQLAHVKAVLKFSCENSYIGYKDLLVRLLLAKKNGMLCSGDRAKWDEEAADITEIISWLYSY